jgi:hypothetical protein
MTELDTQRKHIAERVRELRRSQLALSQSRPSEIELPSWI